MGLTKKQLLELKEKVEEAKTTVSELTGQQTALLQQLKTDFGCKSIEDAEEKLEVLNRNIKGLEKKIEKGTQELEEKFDVSNELEEED
jgi:prefoldin subunit 5